MTHDQDSRNAQKQIIHQRVNICNFQATTDPAADPRPGPTETPILRASAIRSCTIK
jgi:hypothetical protein